MKRLVIFLLAYFSYANVDSLRMSWSYSKTQINSTLGVSLEFLGRIDTFFILMMFCGLSILGSSIHLFSLRQFLIGGHLACVLLFLLFPTLYSLTGYFNPWFMAVCICSSAFMRSAVWPGVINIMENWFRNHPNKAVVMAVLVTGINTGGFYGAYVSNFMQNQGFGFETSMVTLGLMALTVNFLMMFFLDQNTQDAEKLQSQGKKPLLKQDIKDDSKQDPQTTETDPNSNLFRKYGIFASIFLPKMPYYLFTYCFLKSSMYCFVFWAPTYLSQRSSNIATQRGYILGMLDIGSVTGALILGAMMDRTRKRALVMTPFLCMAVISLFSVTFLSDEYPLEYYVVLLVVGLCLGGVFGLISSVVSIEFASYVKQKGVAGKISSFLEGISVLIAAFAVTLVPLFSLSYLFYFLTLQAAIAATSMTLLAVKQYKSTSNEAEEPQQIELQETKKLTSKLQMGT